MLDFSKTKGHGPVTSQKIFIHSGVHHGAEKALYYGFRRDYKAKFGENGSMRMILKKFEAGISGGNVRYLFF